MPRNEDTPNSVSHAKIYSLRTILGDPAAEASLSVLRAPLNDCAGAERYAAQDLAWFGPVIAEAK